MGTSRLPTITAKELIAVLVRLGFQEKPLKATSHRRYIHPDGRRTTVPIHPGQDIGRGLLRKILKDLEITPEEFKNCL
ncbi:MAG TPA: type II toxin-antitoxin system HicA family toxin [bacterium]|nr:type II toxin-antitoxin system HicA family toxin [bacterium]HQP99771.1 type II toxin-antitoxin system HicA family toxin [bacterium]